MIRIALADDHALFRKGTIAMLGEWDDFSVVLEANNGIELIEQLGQIQVDLVLMDLEMPEMDGIAATKQLRDQYPDVKVIILSMHDKEEFIIHLMELGANGYLLKTSTPEEVEAAIRSSVETGYYFSDMVSKVMLSGLVKKQKVAPTFRQQDRLTERELEVLELICKEHTTSEIAEKLFLSPRTVDGHRNNLMDKTGARNTAGLVVYAMKNGLVAL